MDTLYILLETNSPAQSKSLLETTRVCMSTYVRELSGVIKSPDLKICSTNENVP